ncbi:MAG: polysaccharide biosynthesis protein [Oceanospirillales bacterium]|nr:polysaccharide biosynthesis protein [Oceanospirillales bacterium]
MISSLLKYAPVQVFSALSVFSLIAIQAGFLSTEVYGALAVAMVVLELVRAFSTQWLNASLLRLYPVYTKQDQLELVQVISLTIVLGSLFGFGVIAGVLYVYQLLSWQLLLVLCVLLVVKSLFQYQLELSRLNEQLACYRQATLLQSISAVVISILMLSLFASTETALLALAASYGLGVLVQGWPNLPKIHLSVLKRLFAYGVPIMLAGGVSVMASRVDRLFIAHFYGMSETGIYAAQANLLMGVLGLAFMIVAMPLYPNLVKCTGDRALILVQHKAYLHLLIALTLPALLGLGLLQDEIVTLFLGREYLIDSSGLFWILAIAIYLINFKGHYVDHGLQFLLQTRKLFWVAVVGLVISLVLLPIMLKVFGLIGAALALLIVSSLVTVLSFLISLRNGYVYAIGGDGVKSFLSALVMALYLYVIKGMFPVTLSSFLVLGFYVVSSVMIYLACLWGVNAFNIRRSLFALRRGN